MEEIYRLSIDRYYFYEFTLISQQNNVYALVAFLNRSTSLFNALKEINDISAASMAPCEARQQQIRLYKVIDDSTVVFEDSVLTDRFGVSLGVGTDFDNSGLTKVVINRNCGASGGPIPLGCYTSRCMK